MRYLEGDVIEPDACQHCEKHATEVRRLKHELEAAQRAARSASSGAEAAVSQLRKQLTPLYRAMQAVFGEMDAIGGHDITTGHDPRWESWKEKMPGRPAQMIDLLLLHREMSRNQLMTAMRAGKDVVRVTVSKLNVAGLLVKNGGRFSLKPL